MPTDRHSENKTEEASQCFNFKVFRAPVWKTAWLVHHIYATEITHDNQWLRLLCKISEQQTAARKTAAQRDGAFQESLLHFTMALLGSTWLQYSLPWLYLALPDFTTLYHGSPWLYLSLLDSTTLHHGFIWLCSALLDSTPIYTMALLGSSWLYYTLYHDSTTLYHGSTGICSIYLTLVHSTMALLGCTWVDYTLPWL